MLCLWHSYYLHTPRPILKISSFYIIYGCKYILYMCVAVFSPTRRILSERSLWHRTMLFTNYYYYVFLSVGKERFSSSLEILYNAELRRCRRQFLSFSSCSGPKESQPAISQVIDVPIFFDRYSFQSRKTKKIHPTKYFNVGNIRNHQPGRVPKQNVEINHRPNANFRMSRLGYRHIPTALMVTELFVTFN